MYWFYVREDRVNLSGQSDIKHITSDKQNAIDDTIHI